MANDFVPDMVFRCWDSENLKMYYQDDENYFQLYTGNKYSLFDDSDKIIVSNLINEDNVFMQSVGWYDKNKKPIYYGDIIKYTADWTGKKDYRNETGTAIIHRYVNNGVGMLRDFGFEDDEKPFVTRIGKKVFYNTFASWDGTLVNLWYEPSIFEIEVVGNIFETPQFIN